MIRVLAICVSCLGFGAVANTNVCFDHFVDKQDYLKSLKRVQTGSTEPNARLNDYTLLYIAAEGGTVEQMKLLLEHGADPSIASRQQARPISATVLGRCYVDKLRVLLNAGVPVDYEFQFSGASGTHLLHEAVKLNDLRCLRLLIDRGADVQVQDNFNRTPFFFSASKKAVRLLYENGAKPFHISEWKKDAFYYSVEQNREQLYRSLLKYIWRTRLNEVEIDSKKTSNNNRDSDLDRQLEDAISANCSSDFVVGQLEAGLPVNYQMSIYNGASLLHRAVALSSEKCVMLLTNRDANVNIKNDLGRTPTHYLIDAYMLSILLENGACILIKDVYGFDSVHRAILHSVVEAIYAFRRMLQQDEYDWRQNCTPFMDWNWSD